MTLQPFKRPEMLILCQWDQVVAESAGYYEANPSVILVAQCQAVDLEHLLGEDVNATVVYAWTRGNRLFHQIP